MIDGGVFGVRARARRAHWLPPTPVRGRGEEIGCASSPAVLERRRSLQLSSVGSCEPRKKPRGPSQARRRVRIRLKPPSIRLAKASLAAHALDMATSILGVSLGPRGRAKVVRGLSAGCFSLRQNLRVLPKHRRVQSLSSRVAWKCISICCFYYELKTENQTYFLIKRRCNCNNTFFKRVLFCCQSVSSEIHLKGVWCRCLFMSNLPEV